MEGRMERVQKKIDDSKAIKKFLAGYSVHPQQINHYLEEKKSSPLTQKRRLDTILSRPHMSLDGLMEILPEVKEGLSKYDHETIQLSEVELKYSGYILKEQELVDKMNRLESVKIKKDMQYNDLQSLSAEAREKLTSIQPATIGQASRISGVSPSDVSVLLVHMGR
jgi:tRNA uridine 5-carboxymethylaminomethyl modification enzyme